METLYLVRKDFEMLPPSWYCYNTIEELLKAWSGEIASSDVRIKTYKAENGVIREVAVKTSIEITEK